MNLMDFVLRQYVFEAIETELQRKNRLNKFEAGSSPSPFLFRFKVLKASETRKILRESERLKTLQTTNIKVTPIANGKRQVITFISRKDRYKCIWDFAEDKIIFKDVKY